MNTFPVSSRCFLPDGLIDVELDGLTARPKSSGRKARPARRKRLACCELRVRRAALSATGAVPGGEPAAVSAVHSSVPLVLQFRSGMPRLGFRFDAPRKRSGIRIHDRADRMSA